jgi:serine/threonine protein kinase
MSLLNNRYQILSELGRGGFGHTFLAEDAHLPSRRRCVIKQFKPPTNDLSLLPQLQESFGREASILERVGEEHSQIPKLYAYFVEDEQFYLVQELVDGQTLGQLVRTKGPLKSAVVREIVSSLLEILDYLHARDIIHRDIKPDNIIHRNRDSKPVLIDFGTVKETVTTVYDEHGARRSLIMGTPGYMAMEQAAGLAIYSSDLYSLGWTTIFLLTGKEPHELVDRRTGENHWRRFAPDVDYDLAAVIDKAVQAVSRDRYASAREMLQALHPVQPKTVPSPQPNQSPPYPTLPYPTPTYPAPSIPIPREPVSPRQFSPNSAPPVPPPVESEYLLALGDRWRIPLLFLLIYLPLCVASAGLSNPSYYGLKVLVAQILLWLVCGVAQAILLRKYFNPLAWIGVTIVGAIIVQIISSEPRGSYLALYLLRPGAFILIMGIGQWLMLLKYVKTPQKWLVASLLTASVIFIVYLAELNDGKLAFTGPLINWPLTGLILGTTQALCLRSFRKKRVVERKI